MNQKEIVFAEICHKKVAEIRNAAFLGNFTMPYFF